MANRVHCSSKGARHAVHRCEKLAAAHRAGDLQFFGEPQALEKAEAFAAFLKPLRQIDWVVYAKRPFAGPQAVLAYLSRYTHLVAIANSRLIALDEHGVTFQFKDYRAKGRCRYKPMTLPVAEFMRRFLLLHVLPPGFHRIRHYGLLTNAARVENLARARELLAPPLSPLIAVPIFVGADGPQQAAASNNRTCTCCGAPMVIIETFERGHARLPGPSRFWAWRQTEGPFRHGRHVHLDQSDTGSRRGPVRR